MSSSSSTNVNRDRAYYMDNVKFIRDLVHGYVYLTKFDIELIDTPEFQRLKDIRQLTCQNVYPAARHTRFEHSLGVLELTRQAMKSLNQNGILMDPSSKGKGIFNEKLVFNAALAALLHDVGHCPFSHIGEKEFDKKAVFDCLCAEVEKCPELQGSSLLDDLKRRMPKSGHVDDLKERRLESVHEQMSCLVILQKLYSKLSGVQWESNNELCNVDFELIIRSIIGLRYDDTSTTELYQNNKQKNVIVELINSKIFDMDKLDYIMRDALSTGIGTPKIDTHRLFNNMYINSEQDYTLVFLHRAVPALQNMVEARDALYMYVYNHHVTVFSDFMYSYIFRRFAHNAEAFRHLVCMAVPEETAQAWENCQVGNKLNKLDDALEEFMVDPITSIGVVPKSFLFSPIAILEQYRSDSDLIALLHNLHYLLSTYACFVEDSNNHTLDHFSSLIDILYSEIDFLLKDNGIVLEKIELPDEEIRELIANIHRGFTLINKYQGREFLKPWWKTSFEFANFINQNFRGTPAHKRLGEWICHNGEDKPSGDEFRSQLAKHVIYITKGLHKAYDDSRTGLLEPLDDGDFFVIKWSSRFLDKGTISKLNIALKCNEILGKAGQEESSSEAYFIDRLTDIFPQRDYYELYEEKGFYIFSKPLPEGVGTNRQRERHYHIIEEIFVFVANQLTREAGFAFQEKFVTPIKSLIQENERKSCEKMLEDFSRRKGFIENDKTS